MQCSLQPKSSDAVAQTTETVERWECAAREHEQRFGKALDEDVKIDVIFALAPLSEQNHCHLNSHILKSHAQVGTMPFDCCRAQAEVATAEHAPMDLSMLGKGKQKGKGDKKGKNGKGNDNAKATEYFASYCLGCKACGHIKKECSRNETPKSGKDTATLENRVHRRQSNGIHDDRNAVTILRLQRSGRPHDMDDNEFLIDSGAVQSVCQQSLSDSLGGNASGAGVDLRSATKQQIFMRTRDGVNVSGAFRIAPKTTSLQRSTVSVGQVADRGNIIVFRSSGGTTFNDMTGNRIDLDDTSAKRATGTGGTKMLMGFRARVRGTCGSTTCDTWNRAFFSTE